MPLWRNVAKLAVLVLTFVGYTLPVYAKVEIRQAETKAGYLVRLLLNESPFPGERGWISEENSKATMLAILWVCHGRIHHIPPGYRQEQIAAVRTGDIIDVITAGGEKGQCDGFFRDASGHFRFVSRVQERINNLLNIANQGQPGKFARLILYAQGLSDVYIAEGIRGADRFAGLTTIRKTPVTGRAYSWMTDKDFYSPGENFISIPDDFGGSLGGNRFFTLRK